MYLQLLSVKEPSKKHDIWVQLLFGSLRSKVRFDLGIQFRVRYRFVSWQNLGPGLVRFILVGFMFFPISICHIIKRKGHFHIKIKPAYSSKMSTYRNTNESTPTTMAGQQFCSHSRTLFSGSINSRQPSRSFFSLPSS